MSKFKEGYYLVQPPLTFNVHQLFVKKHKPKKNRRPNAFSTVVLLVEDEDLVRLKNEGVIEQLRGFEKLTAKDFEEGK
jgi:hypothetical protein